MDKDQFIAWRNRMKLSRAEAADLLGVTDKAVGHWETGVRAIPEPIARLTMFIEREMTK